MKVKKVKKELSSEEVAQINIIQKRIEKDPLNSLLYMQLGDLYQNAGLSNEALLEFQKVINIDSSNFEANLKCGLLNFDKNQYEQAAKFLGKALELNADSFEAKRKLFYSFNMISDLDKAIPLGEEIVKFEPQNLELHKILFTLYRKHKKNEGVNKQIEVIIKLAENDKDVLSTVADYYEEQNETELAIKYYTRLLELDSENNSIIISLCRLYCVSNNYEKCIKYILKRLELFKSFEKILSHSYLAYSYIKLGQLQKALQYINSIEVTNYDSFSLTDKRILAEAYYEVGRYKFEQREKELALQYLEKSIILAPGNDNATHLITEAKSEILRLQTARRKKILRYSISGVLIIIIGFATWFLSHGKIEINFEGGRNAQLFVDGNLYKEFNKSINNKFITSSVSIGSYIITLEQDGYHKWEDTVWVGLGQTTIINTNAKRAFGSMFIQSFPSNAEINIDAKRIGRTPIELDSIPTGQHQIALKLTYYIPITDTIIIQDTANDFKYNLDKGFGTVEVIDWWPYIEYYRIGNDTQERYRDRATFYNVEAGWVELYITRYQEWRYYSGFYIDHGETIKIQVH